MRFYKFSTATQFVVLLTVVNGGGCQLITDMDKPMASRRLMWEKSNVSVDKVIEELGDCGNRTDQKMNNASFKDQYNAEDICMLKKGFKFVQKPKNYPNTCSFQAFKDTIGCKSVRGEYNVEVEK